MAVRMELHRIIISELQEQQLIVLRESAGERSFPIVIGTPEAQAIDRRLKGIPTARPLTHDLLATVIERLGATLVRIEISHLQDGAYYAKIHLRQGESVVAIDCRPSDAIALGVTRQIPIFVAEQVLDEAA